VFIFITQHEADDSDNGDYIYHGKNDDEERMLSISFLDL
jgi:hypothetical protein